MLVTEPHNLLKDALRIYPLPSLELSVEDIYKEIRIPSENPRDASLPYVAINMVSSLDGKVARNGKAGSIGGPADRRVVRNIRSRFDATLRGAGTLRADKISLGVTDDLAELRLSEGHEAQPLDLIISSNSATIPLDINLLDITPGRVAVLVPTDSTPVVHQDIPEIQMLATSDGTVDLVPAMKTLKSDHGVDNLLLEGGPTLNHSFVSRNLVDELFLTIAPKLLGGVSHDSLTLMNETSLPSIPRETLRLLSAHVSGDELFLRYALQHPVQISH